MRQTTQDPDAMALLAELDRVLTEVAETAEAAEAAQDKRNDLFMRLRAMGVTQAEIATRAGISEPAVAKAVAKAKHPTPT